MRGSAAGKRLRSSGGFTLGEVLIALFVIAVALLAMAKMQLRSIEAADYAGRMSTALALAQHRIENMQADGWADWNNGGDVCPGAATCPVPTGGVGVYGQYTRTWTVDSVTWGAGIREVTVTVTWSRGRRVTLRSLISQ